MMIEDTGGQGGKLMNPIWWGNSSQRLRGRKMPSSRKKRRLFRDYRLEKRTWRGDG